MPAARPQAASTASATATAASVVISAASCAGRRGRSSALMYSPPPGGEKKLRPRRPRPAVCDAAMSTSPSASPASAACRASALVESTSP